MCIMHTVDNRWSLTWIQPKFANNNFLPVVNGCQCPFPFLTMSVAYKCFHLFNEVKVFSKDRGTFSLIFASLDHFSFLGISTISTKWWKWSWLWVQDKYFYCYHTWSAYQWWCSFRSCTKKQTSLPFYFHWGQTQGPSIKLLDLGPSRRNCLTCQVYSCIIGRA